MRLAIIAPVGRYLGFSAPISPEDQFNDAVHEFPGMEMVYLDPQRVMIYSDSQGAPLIYDASGHSITADVYLAFSHEALDRKMTQYVIRALERAGALVVNGYRALTVADDKALMAIELAGSGLPVAQSFIASARSNVDTIVDVLSAGNEIVISKTSGLTAGGVGVKPLPAGVDFLAPELWSCRLTQRPKIIQNDLDKGSRRRTVVRAYVVGGRIIGSYTTTGDGVVNCAGLARDACAKRRMLLPQESRVVLDAAAAVGASGFCRVDCVDGEKFSILEVNPVPRMDALEYGIDVPAAIIKYAKELYETHNRL